MSTSPASTELDEPISDNEPDSRNGTPCESKLMLSGAASYLRSRTTELAANIKASSETNSCSAHASTERLSLEATSSRERFHLRSSTAEPAPNVVCSLEQSVHAVGRDSESSPLKSTAGIDEGHTPWFSPETRKKMDEEWEELNPTYKLNILQPEPDEFPDQTGTAEPAHKRRRAEPWEGLPPEAFLGFSSSLGARASMTLTGSSAFAMGATCKQALFGGLEKDILMARYSEQLPIDIRLVTKAALDRISRISGMQVIGGEGATPGEANLLIQTKMSQQEFYIGISERPVERFCDHKCSGYTEMHVMVFPDSRASGNMEKNLIVTWQKHPHCMNAGPGGLRASEGRPHFCYVVFRPPALKR